MLLTIKFPVAIIALAIGFAAPAAAGRALANSFDQQSDTIVRRAGAARYPAPPTVVEALHIGLDDSSEQYVFQAIVGILPALDGSIWVLDSPGRGRASSVRQYDANGKYLRSIGRVGQGPGEFTYPGGIAQLPDGRVLVRDLRANRLLVYKPDGRHDNTWTFRSRYNWDEPGANAIRVDVAGVIWLPFNYPPSTNSRSDLDARQRQGIVRIASNGRIIDTVRVPEISGPPTTSLTIRNSDNSRYVISTPYAPKAVVAWSPLGYFVTGVGNRYALDLRIPAGSGSPGGGPPKTPVWKAGDPVTSIRADLPRAVISQPERAELKVMMQSRARGFPGQASGTLPEVPTVKPHFVSFQFDDRGRVFVKTQVASVKGAPPISARSASGRQPSSASWHQPLAFDVFEATGSYVGRVTLPYATMPMAFKRDAIWARSVDEDGVHTVKKFEVKWR